MTQLALSNAGSKSEQSIRSAERKPLFFALVALASVVYIAGLAYYAQVRPIDGDEGYYTTAARLVWEGKTPYKDFSYHQGPLLPYIYSWIWAIQPQSLISMRFLSVGCGGIAVLLWGTCLLCVKNLPTSVAFGTFLAVLLNPYWVSWNVVVKTYALSNLLMTIVTICFYAALHSERLRWYFAAGLALGVCASERTLYGPLVPCVFLWLLCKEWRRSKPRFPKTLTFLAGAMCGLLPIIISFVNDPQEFVFNNLLYHRLLGPQSGPSFLNYGSLRHTIHVYVLLVFFLLVAFYFTAEVILAVIGAVNLRKLRKIKDTQYTTQDYDYFELALLMLVVYVVTALIPFPPFDHYFDSPLVPLLVPFVGEGLRVTFRSGRKWLVVLLAAMAPILFLYDVNRGAKEYAGAPESRLSSYYKVTQIIEANSKIDDIVLSCWTGYVFESGRRYFPGSEDQFNFYVTSNISPEERTRYHVISIESVTKAMSDRTIDVVVTSPWILDNHLTPHERQAFRSVLTANYSMVGQIDTIGVYRRR